MRVALRILATGLAMALSLPTLAGLAARNGQDTPEIQLQLGGLLYAGARYRDALTAYQEAALASEPRVQIPARLGVVRAALRVAEFRLAREEATALLRDRPHDAEVRGLYGDALWSSGLFAEAEQAFRDTLSEKSDDARAHSGLARVLMARGQLGEALDRAQTAIRLAPRNPDFHHAAGVVYERMHRFEDAAAALARYIDFLPDRDRSDNAAWARAEVRVLRSFGRRVPYQIEGSADAVHVVPFRVVDDKVIVRARLNGGGEQDVTVDTGAELTVVSRGSAARHGVEVITYTVSAGVGNVGLRGLQVGRLDRLELGDLKVRNLPCLIKNPPLPELPAHEGDSLSPLAMGLSMSLDYRRGLLTIARRLPAEDSPDVELPLWLYRLATVRGRVANDHDTSFVVDTGGQVISISLATAEAIGVPASLRRIRLKVYGSSGWDADAFLWPGQSLAFSNAIRFDNYPLVVLNLRAPSALLGFELGGIVGHRFLSRYRASIDLEASVLRLKAG